MIRTVGLADPSVEKPQIIVDFGHRAHGRPRIVRSCLLLDRDCRRQALDQIDVRFLHQLEELARVRRERFDIAPLALRVEGVERKRAFAGPGKPGEHDQPLSRQIEVDILKVVGSCAANADVFHTLQIEKANLLIYSFSYARSKGSFTWPPALGHPDYFSVGSAS